MPRPNSLLTRFRFFIVRAIEPGPSIGEAWCVNCSLNGYKTVVVPETGVKVHTRTHIETGDDGMIRMMGYWHRGENRK
jgi:hypothetical protein